MVISVVIGRHTSIETTGIIFLKYFVCWAGYKYNVWINKPNTSQPLTISSDCEGLLRLHFEVRSDCVFGLLRIPHCVFFTMFVTEIA